MSSTGQPFLWFQRCRDLPRFKIYRSGNCICFSDAPPNTRILIVFEDENPGGYAVPVSGNCFCPTADLTQFIQHGKWIYLIAADLLDINTVYACTDYIGNFYASMNLSVRADTRLDIVVQLAPKNVYAVLEVVLSAPLPFPSLPLLSLRDMCWMSTPAGSLPYVCRYGYYVQASLWIDRYCEENQVHPPPWTSTWNAWYTFIDMGIDYQQNRVVLRRMFDETALFNPIDTRCYCVDNVGRRLPIRLTWVDFYRFTVGLYTEVTLYTVTADALLVCANIVGGRCLPTPTGFELSIGNPFKEKESEFTAARQLIGLQLQTLGVLGVSQELISRTVSTASTVILNALSMLPFYTPETPAEGVKPVTEAPITSFVQAVVSSIEGAVSRAIRIVIKNIARTYMVLKTYFELGLGVPTSALILFLNHFINLITDIACRIASKCIGVVSIVLTVPYVVKRLREVAEQGYDVRKPLTSLWKMFTGFREAARDILTVWLTSIFAGAVICTFVKCPKPPPIQPAFIALPDWYVFEDYCADLCREPLIQGRLRNYVVCVNRCITSIAPRKPTEKVIVVERNRVMVYINEYTTSIDGFANVSKPTAFETIIQRETTSVVRAIRRIVNIGESVSGIDAILKLAARNILENILETASLFDRVSTATAQKISISIVEGSGTADSFLSYPADSLSSYSAVKVAEGVGLTDWVSGWIPLLPITPYARWIEAINEYIDPYYGESIVATDTLTGEAIRAGEIGRALHSIDTVRDSALITTKPPIYVLPSDSTEGLIAEAVPTQLLKLVKLASPTVSMLEAVIPPAPTYLRTVQLTSLSRLSVYILVPHATRTRVGVQSASPARLLIYTLVPHATRTRVGVQSASPARLLIYTLVPHATRTRVGVQLTPPARTCAQVTITV